jgi:hypothetical protein
MVVFTRCQTRNGGRNLAKIGPYPKGKKRGRVVGE